MSTPLFRSLPAKRLMQTTTHQARSLHMTGPATFPSPILTASKLASKPLAQTTEAATPQGARPTLSETSEEAAKPVRQFNTSRTLKKVNDSSTIDFAYFPDLAAEETAKGLSVPVLGSGLSAGRTIGGVEVGADNPVMKPEISPTTLHTSYSAMADVHDNSAMSIDFHALAESASIVSHAPTATLSPSTSSTSTLSPTATSSPTEAAAQTTSTLRQLWSGIVEDVVGAKEKAKAVV